MYKVGVLVKERFTLAINLSYPLILAVKITQIFFYSKGTDGNTIS